jgi:hypothetical protein
VYEIWNNPDVAFSCSQAARARYAEAGNWVMLFNALVLAGSVAQARQGRAAHDPALD